MPSFWFRLSVPIASLMIVACAATDVRAREKHAMPSTAEAQGFDIHEIFPDPRMAELAEAVAAGDDARVRSLAVGADLSYRGDKHVTLLQWALLNKRLDSMRALLDAGADPLQPGMDGDTVVHTAAMANDASYLTELLGRRVNPNVPNATTGAGPLRSALMGERDEQFRALLAAGADPDMPDRMGNTPLHVAGQINEPARALDLLNAGADPLARNAQGATFQRYLFMTRAALLNAETRRDREAVEAWLKAHGIPFEGAR
jgi:uncharacterized protein